MLRSDDLLQNDSHLLFFQPVRSGTYIGFRMLTKRGGVYAFDGLHQLLQADQKIRMMIGQHEGFIHASERQVLRILEQAGRTHGQRVMNLRQKSQQTVAERTRELSFHETLLDLSVVVAVNSEIEQIVFGDELIKQISC